MRRPVALSIALLALAALVLAGSWMLVAHGPAIARVEVAGGDGGGLARARPQEEHFDGPGLERALADPITDGLQVLIIMRDDHIVVERYRHGLDAESMIDSGRFAEALLALAAGIASHDGVLSAPAPSGFDPAALRIAIERGSSLRYETYLSRKLWSRLNATAAWIALPASGAATPADCCFHARVLDWLRVASLLVDDGRFEGKQVVPAGWVRRMARPVSLDAVRGSGVELPVTAHGIEPFAAEGVFFLRGPGRWRLWLVPSLRLAVLAGAAPPAQSPTALPDAAWDETRLPNLVIRALSDRPPQPGDLTDLQRLVPSH
jgi:hypothetical protein